jgi:hypothetical protein
MPVTLLSSLTPSPPTFNMLNDGSNIYWFHHKPSFPSLNPYLYDDIISRANNSIDVWDPYFHAVDSVIFSNVRNNLVIKILTSKGLTGANVNYVSNVIDAIKITIPKPKNTSFCLGVIDLSDQTKKDWDFHDRFLIIDNSEVYIIGASATANYISKITSGIYKVQNPDTCNFIIDQFNIHWGQTTKEPPTIQFLHP